MKKKEKILEEVNEYVQRNIKELELFKEKHLVKIKDDLEMHLSFEEMKGIFQFVYDCSGEKRFIGCNIINNICFELEVGDNSYESKWLLDDGENKIEMNVMEVLELLDIIGKLSKEKDFKLTVTDANLKLRVKNAAKLKNKLK